MLIWIAEEINASAGLRPLCDSAAHQLECVRLVARQQSFSQNAQFRDGVGQT
jgi:hypothetical protein